VGCSDKPTHAFSPEFRAKYLTEVGISRCDKEAIRYAYETAHRIREFEIDLYWRRTAYIWAMQAALIGIAVISRSFGDTTFELDTSAGWGSALLTSRTSPSEHGLIATILVSMLAFIVASLWLTLITGAKFWQDNWERHVDILGQELGQNLYQVYPIILSPKGRRCDQIPPYSVTKINKYLVYSFIFFWLAYLSWALGDLGSKYSGTSGIGLTFAFFGFTLIILAVIFLFCLIQFTCSRAYNGMRMSNFGKPVAGLPNGPEDPKLYQRSRSERL
jgi:MFS family permease